MAQRSLWKWTWSIYPAAAKDPLAALADAHQSDQRPTGSTGNRDGDYRQNLPSLNYTLLAFLSKQIRWAIIQKSSNGNVLHNLWAPETASPRGDCLTKWHVMISDFHSAQSYKRYSIFPTHPKSWFSITHDDLGQWLMKTHNGSIQNYLTWDSLQCNDICRSIVILSWYLIYT